VKRGPLGGPSIRGSEHTIREKDDGILS